MNREINLNTADVAVPLPRTGCPWQRPGICLKQKDRVKGCVTAKRGKVSGQAFKRAFAEHECTEKAIKANDVVVRLRT